MSVLYVYAATADDRTLERLAGSLAAQLRLRTDTLASSWLILDKPRSDLPPVIHEAFGDRLAYQDPFVPCMETGRAFCLSRFRNASFRLAREVGAEWLFLCDADTIIARPPTIPPGQTYLHPDVYWQREPGETVETSLKIIEAEGHRAFSQSNSWFIVHRDIFSTMEFNENIAGYGWEDIEFNDRVWAAGHRHMPSGAQVIHHYHPDSVRALNERQYARNKAISDAAGIATAHNIYSPWREVETIEAVHPEWRGFLWLDPSRGVAIHQGANAIGRLRQDEATVTIEWAGGITDVFRRTNNTLEAAGSTAVSDTVYDTAFFDAITSESIRSARRCVPDVIRLVQPQSVVDVGCGRAAFLHVFEEAGIGDVLGLDGDYVDRSRLLIDPSKFIATDLQAAQKPDRAFDFAVCLEVAEHIEHGAGPKLIKFLSELAPIVWFSAALPGQGGTDHINEQWPDYWASQFKAVGMVACDCLRPRWLNDEAVSWWYGQNSLLFIDPLRAPAEAMDRIFKATAQIGGAPRIIHPALHHIRHKEFAAALGSK
ncbi:methyltransferase domain-containing protein [Methylorubrum aminovorans]|uniref:methyltransferase domain-containing protein n=1 Tax=Methylorubrum aminovorans TaxID=269069 RepID=UPI003C3047C9